MSLLLVLALQLQVSPPIAVTQSRLDVMTDACHAPRRWLKHMGGDEIRFRPSNRADYDQVDCVLRKMKESNVPMNLGFIGNELAPNADPVTSKAKP